MRSPDLENFNMVVGMILFLVLILLMMTKVMEPAS